MGKKIISVICAIAIFCASMFGSVITCILSYKSIIFLTELKVGYFLLSIFGALLIGVYSLVALAVSFALFESRK